MKKTKTGGRARFRDPIERDIESALCPGEFISYGKSFSFVQALEELATRIDPLIDDDPERAANIYETFLAGCYAKTREHNDSSGELGNLMQRLCCRWVRARQSADEDPGDTATTLVQWIDGDDYGYTYDIERDLADALDDAGRGALAQVARARFEQAAKEATRRQSEPAGDASKRAWADVLRALYKAQKCTFSYIRLCQQMGMRDEDCLAIAELFQTQGETNQALSWVRRGLETEGRRGLAYHELQRRERALVAMLGRPEEALELAWKAFEAHPGSSSYGELMNYAPEDERAIWHERAMARAEGGDIHTTIDLYLATRETKRLAERVRRSTNEDLTELSPYTIKDVAKRLRRPHPEMAARLFSIMGLETVNNAKSQHYPSAVANLKRAKKCYEEAGLVDEWSRLVDDIGSATAGSHRSSPSSKRCCRARPRRRRLHFWRRPRRAGRARRLGTERSRDNGRLGVGPTLVPLTGKRARLRRRSEGRAPVSGGLWKTKLDLGRRARQRSSS